MYQPRGEEAPGLRKQEGGVGEANSLVAASVYAEGEVSYKMAEAKLLEVWRGTRRARGPP